MTDLSIIIVTYKGWQRLDKCLASLESISGSRFSKEVIIVDNTPDPDEISSIKNKYTSFKFIRTPVNGGYGYGVNHGAKTASGKYLLVLNPDTVVSQPAIDHLVEFAQNDSANAIISCRQVNEKGRECNVNGVFPAFLNLTGILRSIFRPPLPVKKGNIIYPDWISGSVMLIARSTFDKLNGFDEDFWMYFEDTDICRRLSESGGEVALLTDTVIEHNHGASSRTDIKTTSLTKTEVHISRHVFISKHIKGFKGAAIQTFLVINNLLTNMLVAVPGLVFFFIPKIFARALIFKNLVAYYTNSIQKGTWISPRSVNYRKPPLSMA